MRDLEIPLLQFFPDLWERIENPKEGGNYVY
jgi:hypothetical protein